MTLVGSVITADGNGEGTEAMDDPVGGGEGWDVHGGVLEDNGVRDSYRLGGGLDELKAAVVFEGRANVVAEVAAVVPGFTRGSFGVGDDSTSWWAHGSGVEVEWTIEVLPGGDAGLSVGLS